MFNRGHWKQFEDTPAGPRVKSRGKNGKPDYNVRGADEKSFSTDWLMDRTLEFVEANKSKPFCYMLSLPDPHGPDSVRAPYDTMFDDQTYEKPTTYDLDDRAIPAWGEPAKKTGFGQSKYYGMVKCIDDNVGRLITKLKDEDILEKTLIVFTADHGDLRGEHHRQNKGVPWEGSVRVPFLVYYPNSVPAGTVVDQALTSVDFAPTLMTMVNVKTDQVFHGRDFSKLLAGTEDQTNWNDVAFARGTGDQAGWLMAVSDRYKLVMATNDRPWLFDLERDPDEVLNMINNVAYREIARELAKELENYGATFNDPRASAPSLAADLKWAAHGNGPYPGRTQPIKKAKK